MAIREKLKEQAHRASLLASAQRCRWSYRMPDFFVVGAQKAGTTALHDMLEQHPHIHGGRVKEVHYFDNDEWYARSHSSRLYHAHFPRPAAVPAGHLVFETTPSYLYHPNVAQRVHQYRPDAKIIVVLREPASRALSAWTMYHHHFASGLYSHLHDPRAFDDAIREELSHAQARTWHSDPVGYVQRGVYVGQLERYFQYFGRDAVLLLESQELRSCPTTTLNRVWDFLRVPRQPVQHVVKNRRRSQNHDFGQQLAELREHFAPHNERLFQLLGRRYDW